MLLENQEKALKTHFLDYLEQHKRLDELKANQVNLNSNRMSEAAVSAYKKIRHTIQMTNDRPSYILP